MAALLPIPEARKLIIDDLVPLGSERVKLAQALGRVLAADAVAGVSHPPADVSAMDGYAVRRADIVGVGQRLNVVGESAAGHPSPKTVGAGEAVRIFTGAHVPKGADCVILQEDTTVEGNVAVVNEAPRDKQHIRPAGQDFRTGDVVLKAPRRLTARDVGLLAAMNLPEVTVARRPKIGVLSTGDEIVRPGEMVREGQIVSANGPGLCAFVTAHGGEAVDLGVVKDDAGALLAVAERAKDLDLLVTSGGVSVGDYDVVKGALSSAGFKVGFHKIAMRPGKPLLYGRLKNLPVLGLPGNPVSALVCAVLFLSSAIARLQGLAGAAPETSAARLGTALPANDGRTDHLRATLSRDAAGWLVATPFPKQDSGMVSALARAQALIVREPQAAAAAVGDVVSIIELN